MYKKYFKVVCASWNCLSLETAERWHQDIRLGIFKRILFWPWMLYFWSTLGAAYTLKSENIGSFAWALSRFYAFFYLTSRSIREPDMNATIQEIKKYRDHSSAFFCFLLPATKYLTFLSPLSQLMLKCLSMQCCTKEVLHKAVKTVRFLLRKKEIWKTR